MFRLPSVALAIAMIVVLGCTGSTQATPLSVPEGDGSRAYQDAIRWTRLASEVTYLDPASPLPEMDGIGRRPRGDDPSAESRSTPDWVFQATVVVLLSLLVLFIWNASRGQFVRFGTWQDDTAAPTGDVPDPAGPLRPDSPVSLADIRAEPDRRAATIALLRLALPHAATANSLRLHPSWTARDVLARIPERWPLRHELAGLTRAAEEAHFGDYPVGEERFAQCLAVAERILAQGAPA